jgi:C-terminal processing protease CtpA/Prc
LEWFNLPEKISDGPFRNSSPSFIDNILAAFKALSGKKIKLQDCAILNKPMVWHAYAELCEISERIAEEKGSGMPAFDRHQLMGDKRGVLPSLGKVIWVAPDSYIFRAYMYKTPDNKTIGYVRIPDYSFEEDAPKQFALMMSLFNKATDALVIDQLHNPGGSMFYCYSLASMLATKPIQVPTHRVTITQEDVHSALTMIKTLKELEGKEITEGAETLHDHPMSSEFASGMLHYFEFVVDQWNNGSFFSEPTFLYGVKTLKPHQMGAYSKPILLLVNNLDFSGGDFFPAILQDNKRATVFGSRTAGAGGFVLSHSYPNRFGVASFSLTGSIAERMDKNPIENLGVTPDINYELTANDLQNGYPDYIKAVNQALSTIIKKKG